MNRPIRKVAVLAAVMFFAMLANITYLELGRAESLNQNPANRRVMDAEYARPRGAILVGNTPIAQSRATGGGRFAYARSYADPELYATVTGYYSYLYGSSGIELNHSQDLAGTSDSQFLSRIIDTLSGRTAQGASIQTTINPEAQKAAYEGLDGRKGAVVAIDYTTGAVLAAVSLPTYDPNQLSSTNLPTTTKAWQQLNADKNRPLNNRSSKEIYPPGSTFKLVTAAAALENGYSKGTMVQAPAKLRLPQTSIDLTNETNCGDQQVSLEHALNVSCNTAYANVAMDLGQDKLRDQAEKFGFDKTIDSDVPWAASRFPDKLNQAQLAMSGIGQFDVAATPLQMAMVTAGVANDGRVMTPYLSAQVRGANLQVLEKQSPKQLSRAMSPANARQLQDMMVSTVTDGTGTSAQIDQMTVGGKTGTAQSDPKRPPYAWFTSFSKENHVAVTVFIEEANIDRNEISGGGLAGPIARRVMEAVKP